MKNLHLLWLLACFTLTSSSSLLGQNRGSGPQAGALANEVKSSISGTVFDGESDSPLDYATVSIYNADQELVTGTITEADGSFRIEVQPGTYSIRVEFLGYEPYRIEDVQLSRNEQLDLGRVDVSSSAAQLDEVTVTATRSTMQLALDKRIFNVGSDLVSRGGSATELLDNVPSVQVDVEGNVSLRGSSNVRILINGRPSNLLGSDGAGLRQLPANLIERIEVITNPSARYEAEGTGGIINIILREDRAKGLNGSFDLTVGRPDNFGTSINLNRRANKLNFFTNLGVTYRNGPGDGSLYNETFNEDVTLISIQNNQRLRSGLGANFRFGADYFFNERNTLTTAFSYRYGDDNNENITNYFDYENSLDNPTGSEIRLDEEKEDDRRLEYSLNYKLTFPNNEGQQLTADIRYQDNTETEGSDLSNRFFDALGNPADRADLIQRSNNTESEDQFIFQSDYVHPFGEDHQLEAGVRASIRNIDNDFLVEELDNDTDVFFPLEGLSNTFAYDERVYAAYLTYGNKFGRFSFQLGIRPEYSEINTRLIQTNEINERDFLNFFPSAFINYELPGENSIQISYSRRISRPRFWTLNPFFTFTDNRNFFAGNPNLNPEFTNSFELGHLKYFDKGSISSALYYRKTFDVVQRLRTVDELGNSVTLPQNLATRDAYGLEIALNYDIARWWSFSTDLNFFGFQTEGEALEQDFSAEGFSWFTRGTSRFKINPKLDAQIRYNYRAPQNNAQGQRRSISSIDLAASQDLWKDRATLTLSVRDLFNSRRRRFISEGVNFFAEGDFRWRVRQVDLTLSYRLNQEKQRRRGGDRRRGGSGYDGGGEGEF